MGGRVHARGFFICVCKGAMGLCHSIQKNAMQPEHSAQEETCTKLDIDPKSLKCDYYGEYGCIVNFEIIATVLHSLNIIKRIEYHTLDNAIYMPEVLKFKDLITKISKESVYIGKIFVKQDDSFEQEVKNIKTMVTYGYDAHNIRNDKSDKMFAFKIVLEDNHYITFQKGGKNIQLHEIPCIIQEKCSTNLLDEYNKLRVMMYLNKTRILIKKQNEENEKAKKIIDNCLTCLQELHSKGLVHKDIKPNNIMICNNSIKLIDCTRTNMVPSTFGTKMNGSCLVA